MNQAINKIPYGLLTEEEQALFRSSAKKRGMYEIYSKNHGWVGAGNLPRFLPNSTYRLKMVEGEIYYYEISSALGDYNDGVSQWYDGLWKRPSEMHSLRPATAEEIKKFNKAFEPEEEVISGPTNIPGTPQYKEPDAAHKPGPVEADLQQKPEDLAISLAKELPLKYPSLELICYECGKRLPDVSISFDAKLFCHQGCLTIYKTMKENIAPLESKGPDDVLFKHQDVEACDYTEERKDFKVGDIWVNELGERQVITAVSEGEITEMVEWPTESDEFRRGYEKGIIDHRQGVINYMIGEMNK